MSRMKKPMPIRPKARKVSFCQLFLMYKRKTKLVMTAAMQVPRARPVQMKLICLFGTPTFKTKINLSASLRHCFPLKVIDLGCKKGLRWSKDAHGEAEAAMAGPGKGEVGGEPGGLPRAAHHPSSEQGPSLPSKWGQPPPQLQNAPLRESPGKLREHLLQRTKQFE